MKKQEYQNMYKHTLKAGFTLIELMVAILIFAIISVISYRTLSSLVTTKQIVTSTQDKWSGIGSTINWFNTSWAHLIPLVVRDGNGLIIPAMIGKTKLDSQSDSQLELTLSGYVRDPNFGSTPPKRLGFRFVDGKLFLVTWPVLNRVQSTQPQLDLLMDNVDEFTVEFLYPDRQWRDTWPQTNMKIDQIPLGLRVTITMSSGETIMRQWAR
jgi:general secretion pathway protein J